MLVFAVLRDSSGITADTGEVLVVHNVQHQLVRWLLSWPIGALTRALTMPAAVCHLF